MRKTNERSLREPQWRRHSSRYIGKYSCITKSLLVMTESYSVSHITLPCSRRAFYISIYIHIYLYG